MDSEDDMLDANDLESLDDEFYSGETGMGSDDGDADYGFVDNDSDDSDDIVSHRQQVTPVGPSNFADAPVVLGWVAYYLMESLLGSYDPAFELSFVENWLCSPINWTPLGKTEFQWLHLGEVLQVRTIFLTSSVTWVATDQ